jgi:hypothetical protein
MIVSKNVLDQVARDNKQSCTKVTKKTKMTIKKRTDPVLKAPTQVEVWGRIIRGKSYHCNIIQRGYVETKMTKYPR